MEFENVYQTPTDLTVTKTVVGGNGNPLNDTKEFEYTVTFTAPATGDVGAITATHYDSSNTDTVLTAPNYGVAYTFTIKNGEKVVFSNLAAGTTYVITETGEEYYTPSVKVTEGGTEKATVTGEYSESLTATGTALQPNPDQNKVDYTNTYSITPPTGIKLNNEIIIISVIALALIAGGWFAVVKIRSAIKK